MKPYESQTDRSTDSNTLAASLDVEPLPTTHESDDWPVEYDGYEFFPIPESWIAHDNAHDRDGSPDQLYAVSAAAVGGTIKVRYTHATKPGVLVPETSWLAVDDGYVPRALATTGWPRSLPIYRDQPAAHRERCETRQLADLWSERSAEVQSREEIETMLADGGQPTLEAFL
jgi:hypothetical protein